MTRPELQSRINRRTRLLTVLVSLANVWLFAPICLGLYHSFLAHDPHEITDAVAMAVLVGSWTIAVLCAGLFMWVLSTWPIRCPHCGAPIGRHKKRFYDVVSTGLCKECNGRVIDEMD